MTLTADEFLRRFLLHVLPKGFVRIRFSGFLSNRCRKKLLPLAQRLLKVSPPPPPAPAGADPSRTSAWRCPRCGATMVLIERLTAQQIHCRSTAGESFVDTS